VSRLSAVKPAYWISGVLLMVAIVVPLLVPTFAKVNPHLRGFPFFYWYQLMWVFLSAILVSISYRLLRAEERKRRAAQGLGDPDAPEAGAAKEGDQ
jgi:Na+/proline symporter